MFGGLIWNPGCEAEDCSTVAEMSEDSFAFLSSLRCKKVPIILCVYIYVYVHICTDMSLRSSEVYIQYFFNHDFNEWMDEWMNFWGRFSHYNWNS